MTRANRRMFLVGAGAAGLLTAACSNGVGSEAGAEIDRRSNQTLNFMLSEYPGTQDLKNKSTGVLVMPLVSEAAFGVGAGYGEGALQINDQTVDYYSAASGSFGFQAGAQQYSHVLFFMTPEALEQFRTSPGWEAGGNIQYAFNDQGSALNATTNTLTAPIIAVIFGQAGLLAGANVEGTKYTRIIR